MYRAMGFAHATTAHHLHGLRGRLADERGQGTIEYVGLILLIATVMAVVASVGKEGDIAKTVVTKITEGIDKVGGGKK